jgi:hypothetical protein
LYLSKIGLFDCGALITNCGYLLLLYLARRTSQQQQQQAVQNQTQLTPQQQQQLALQQQQLQANNLGLPLYGFNNQLSALPVTPLTFASEHMGNEFTVIRCVQLARIVFIESG